MEERIKELEQRVRDLESDVRFLNFMAWLLLADFVIIAIFG